MLSYEQILELINKLSESDLTEVNLVQGDFQINLKRQAVQNFVSHVTSSLPMLHTDSLSSSQMAIMAPSEISQERQQQSTEEKQIKPVSVGGNLIEIKSPMVGTFYESPSPENPAFVAVGQKIKVGDTLCIIEAMKVMNEFPSDIAGVIEEICVENKQTVEFGQVLFRIKPN